MNNMINMAAVIEQRKINNRADKIELPQAFVAKFPKLKAEKAEKLFRRYIDVVWTALMPRLCCLNGGETYLSTKTLHDRCADFKYKGNRFYVWTEFNDIYPFIQIVEKGSNLHVVANGFQKNSRVRVVNHRLLAMVLEERSPAEVFLAHYDVSDLNADCGVLLIDVDNLDRFIGCTSLELESAEAGNHRDKLNRNLWQARIVRKIAQHTIDETGKAFLPMIMSPSMMGRTYYKGVNIQSVSKQVRSAILGQHYQYDMRAAVNAVKLALYGILNGGDNQLVGTAKGTRTREYIANKEAIRKRLARDCFEGIDLPEPARINAIKAALTAIGFGARTSAHCWMTKEGIRGTALSDIIKSPLARERFLGDDWVREFLKEQRAIEDEIIRWQEADASYEEVCALLQGEGEGRATRARKMAYIYQQGETAFMDAAVDVLQQYGIEVIARIHDAFIVRDKLPARVMDEISAAWGWRPYMRLDCDEVREWVEPEFKRALTRADSDLIAHKRRIEVEEGKAEIVAQERARA